MNDRTVPLLAALLAAGIVLGGCASMFTKWECASSNCLPKYQATNKCLAQANAAFTRQSNKETIWAQCMRGEGYQDRVCTVDELKTNQDCQIFHVH